jgi:hypothetical protein
MADPTSAWKPVDESAAPAGWTPVEEPAASPATPQQPSGVMSTISDVLKGVGKSGLSTLQSIDEGVHHVLPSSIANFMSPQSSIDYEKQHGQANNTAQSIGKGLGSAAQFLIPGGAEEAGAGAIARIAPKIAPIAKMGMSALGSGAVNAAQGGSFGTGAVAGAAGAGIGAGLRKIGGSIAETALGVRGADRAFGRTPGEAILADTRGIKPGTVARTAQDKSNELTSDLERMAGASPKMASAAPAVDVLDNNILKYVQRNSPVAQDLKPIRDQLTSNLYTGRPIPQIMKPSEILNLRRGLSDTMGRWTPEQAKGAKGVGRQAYHALSDAFHDAVPESADVDQRISSLIPVAARAGATDLSANTLQRTLGRIARPTGGLVGAVGGGAAGYRHDGAPGAVVGAALGAGLPELIGSPTAQMAVARSLASPGAQKALIPLIRGGVLQADR